MHKDPIQLSLISICIVSILSFLVIITCKPLCAVDVDSDKNTRINRGKAVSISVLIGIVTGIIVFLITMDKTKQVIPQDDVVKNEYNKLSNAY